MTYATLARTDLGAIRRNLEAVRARVGRRAVLAAVKADAYGHGAVEVSRLIERTGCADWLGVATVPEALELRAAGVALPILKFTPVLSEAEADACVAADIDLTVIEEFMPISARFIANKASYKFKYAQLTELLNKMKEALAK